MNYKIIRFIFVLIFIANISHTYSPKIIAHRGGGKEFPENTIFAFEQSLAYGADGIEVDVQLSKDNVVALYHPRDLSINTNGKGKISDFTFALLQKLDAAYHFPSEQGKNHKIPSLAEVIDKFPRIEIIVDLIPFPVTKYAINDCQLT